MPFVSNEALLILLALMAIFRAVLLDRRLQPLSACNGCVALLTFKHDAAVLGTVLLASALTHWVRASWVRALLRTFLCLVVAAYGLDLLIIVLYNMRLVVADFFKYGREVGGIVTITGQMIRTPAGVATLVVGVVLAGLMAVFVRAGPRLGRTGTRRALAAGLVLFLVGLLPSPGAVAQSWAYLNLFEINLDRGAAAPYSDAFAATLRASHEDLRTGGSCTVRPARRPDVLMVVVEGLSAYQSQFFSGVSDGTPNLDRIARRHTAFTRFHANGYTTEGGLIALLGGQVPLPATGPVFFGGGFVYDGFFDLPSSLPRLFGERGYRTAFLTTGDLAFGGKGAWLETLGFDEVDGHDDPFYDGWPRMHFRAAPDSALYLRALRWLDEQPGDTPFFLVVETVSSHHPFIEPTTHRKSESAAFAYADRQLGHFYDTLDRRGRLDSLMLVVVSDHRTMTPLRPEESALYGEEAHALVPLVIADPDRPGPQRVEARFQQVDLATSFDAMLSGRSCTTAIRGDLLADPPAPPRCTLHARADDRGKVDIACGDDRATVRLHGDDTRLENGSVPDAGTLMNQIDLERIERRFRRRR